MRMKSDTVLWIWRYGISRWRGVKLPLRLLIRKAAKEAEMYREDNIRAANVKSSIG